MKNKLRAIAVVTAMAACLQANASITGTITEFLVPYDWNGLQQAHGTVYTVLEPLSLSFDIQSSQVNLDFTAWLYKSYPRDTYGVSGVCINGVPYDVARYRVPVGKTVTPNALYGAIIPESALNYGVNEITWDFDYDTFVGHGPVIGFMIKATVIRS